MTDRSVKFIQELSSAVSRGEDLLKLDIKSSRRLEDVLREVKRWDRINRELLAAIDTVPQGVPEYSDLVALPSVASDELREDLRVLRTAIRDRIDYLTLIKEKAGIWGRGLSGSEVSERVAGARLRVFIVHGHDMGLLFETKDFFQNTLGHVPVVLFQQANVGRTIIEKFEEASANVDVAVVLLTADDFGGKAGGESSHRVRQNVVFELGYFVGRLGRKSGRVLVLHRGDLEMPSDLSGIIYIDVSVGVAKAGEEIRRELASLGLRT